MVPWRKRPSASVSHPHGGASFEVGLNQKGLGAGDPAPTPTPPEVAGTDQGPPHTHTAGAVRSDFIILGLSDPICKLDMLMSTLSTKQEARGPH